VQLDPALRNIEIRGLSADSRSVEPGFLFAAIPGGRADGRHFIDDAIDRGAVAVLAPPGTESGPSCGRVPTLVDENPRRRLALMAARFYDRQPEHIAAVTGTNGKTSVVSFLRQIWTILGRPAASLGTLGLEGAGSDAPASLTTPDPVALHRMLADIDESGISRLAIEASSHGLDQFRLDGVRVTAAAFTNLTRDHLDYHGTASAYLAAKMRLFGEVMTPGGRAVLNADAPESEALAALCRTRGHKVLTYGRAGRDVRLIEVEAKPDSQRLAVEVLGTRHIIKLPLVGAFQASNALCALALALSDDAEAAAAIGALGRLRPVRGRLERAAQTMAGAPVYVDYAHTPDALSSVLAALRAHAGRNLVVVFGCGGDRDPGKRPEMGAIAEALADRAFVTDDNPRREDPASIRRAILATCPSAVEIGDRATAIRTAIAGLEPGDVLVLAGKGHESGQIVGDTVRPFDDAEMARHAVKEIAASEEARS
jgi:UDP-N-acetylmuramoyl-L-alanyl-D-glutamate--2,6-diaminopimelate ligase